MGPSHPQILSKKSENFPLSSPRGDESDKKESLVKRIVGLPNETIKIEKGEIFLNGEPLRDDPLGSTYKNLPSVNLGPIKLPPDGYFYIGDNRGETTLGVVLEKDIRGKVMFVK